MGTRWAISGKLELAATRLIQGAFLLVVYLVIASSPVRAQTKIDFENLASSTVVLDQYDVVGIQFNGPRASQYPAGFSSSGTKAIELCFAMEFCTSPLEITMQAAQRSVSLWVGSSVARQRRARVVLRAFDALDQQVGLAFVDLGPSSSPINLTHRLKIELATPMIKRVTLGYAPAPDGPRLNNGLVVDDLEISGSPEPMQCNISTPPAIEWTTPENGRIVNVNLLRISGSVASLGSLQSASLTVSQMGVTMVTGG